MARLNLEERLWQDPRFKILEKKLGSKFMAIGALIEFWRLAQEYWGRDRELIPMLAFEAYDIPKSVIEVGFAEIRDGHIYAIGSEKNFDWLVNLRKNAKKGGDASAAARANKINNINEADVIHMDTQKSARSQRSLLLAPSSLLSTLNKKGNISAPALPILGQLWNEHCENLPKIKACSSLRQRHSEARWREKPDKDYWIEIIRTMVKSDFCNGKNDRAWLADFDFFIKPDTHNKVLEGKYENRKSNLPKTKTEVVSAHNQGQYDRIKKGML